MGVQVTTSSFQSSAIPIVIGVTGHRDLRSQDVAVLNSKVREFLTKILANYRYSPIVILSALAEGADRLVARIALEYVRSFPGRVTLHAVLPMPEEEYKQDFLDQASRDEFDQLLWAASKVTIIPTCKSNNLPGIRDKSNYREVQYTRLGVYVAKVCHILLALWDGKHLCKPGGTSHVVRMKREGIGETLFDSKKMLLDATQSGSVYHIVTSRQSSPNPMGGPFEIIEEGDSELRNQLESALTNIDNFNKDDQTISQKLEYQIKQAKNWMIANEVLRVLHPSEKDILEKFSHADVLATFFQKRRYLLIKGLLLVTLLAVIFFEVHAHIWQDPISLSGYLLSLSLGFVMFQFAKKTQYENKHLDYRALAEGMRIQFFWRLAGINECVADHYLSNKKSELDWICMALRAWDVALSDSKNEDPDLTAILKFWVQGQKDFFETKTSSNYVRFHNFNAKSHRLFLCGIALALVACVIGFIAKNYVPGYALVPLGMHPHGPMYEWLIVIMGLLPALAAAFESYTDKMLIAPQAKQYSRMSTLFEFAERKLVNLMAEGKTEMAQTLLFELGKEALDENSDWVILHRERPLEMVKKL